MGVFGFDDYEVEISTRPEKSIGTDDMWKHATEALEESLKEKGIAYNIQEGEGAFYGPKIDFNITDSMGRGWQCSTIQVDFFQPENFDLTYVASDGTKKRPVIIHRAIYGSLERFLGILLEHYKGKLPFWLAPVQISILTITDKEMPYARTIYQDLKDKGYRITIDESSDPISGKIKNAQLKQIPWMLDNLYTLLRFSN